MKKRIYKAFACIGIAALMMSGCGSNEVKVEETKQEESTKEEAKEESTEAETEEAVNAEDVEADKHLTILASSDVHGRIYPYDYAVDEEDNRAGYTKIASIVKAEREKNPDLLLFDCGDLVQDNSAELFNDMDVHPMVQCLNDLHYDTWALGNHEFNFSLPFLERNMKAFEGTVLAANIYKEGTDERYVDGYKIFDVDGVRVAVIGLVAPYVPIWEASTPAHFEGLEFRNATEESKKAIKELEGKYDVLVGTYHIGPDGEHGGDGIVEIVKQCPEFDLMIGGHAHQDFNEIIEVEGKKIPVIEPYKWGRVVAKASVALDEKDGKYDIAAISAENLATDDVEADKEMLDKYKFVHDKSIEDANMVVGEVTEDFINGVDYITGEDIVTTMPRAMVEDTALLDFINKVQTFYSGADIATVAAFKPNMNLKKGEFKKKDVANIYKFPNTLNGVNMTGENLKKFMEFSARFYNQYQPGDVTISFNPEIRSYMYDMFSGVDYEIDISKPVGERIVNLTFNGEAVSNDKIYKVAVNNYRLGTLITEGFATLDDVYYDSYEEYQDNGRIRNLIIKYVNDECDGKISPECDYNWKITGAPDLENPKKDEVYTLIKEGKVKIPTSADERTPNVKSVNINELIEEGVIEK